MGQRTDLSIFARQVAGLVCDTDVFKSEAGKPLWVLVTQLIVSGDAGDVHAVAALMAETKIELDRLQKKSPRRRLARGRGFNVWADISGTTAFRRSHGTNLEKQHQRGRDG